MKPRGTILTMGITTEERETCAVNKKAGAPQGAFWRSGGETRDPPASHRTTPQAHTGRTDHGCSSLQNSVLYGRNAC